MKYKILLGIAISLLVVSIAIVVSIFSYSFGFNAGNTTGYTSGYDRGSFLAYEKGYVSGYDNGKEFVVNHLDQYVKVPKSVKYDEVVAFLKEDKTSEERFVDRVFDCISFANIVKENADKRGVKCALVSMDLFNANKDIGHAINCFETTDKGIVYFDPQTDGQRYGIYVGGTYVLQGVTYKITKVDIIW